MATFDEILDQKIATAVQQYAATIAKGDPGDEGPAGEPGNVNFPGWLNDGQLDAGWSNFLLLRDRLSARVRKLPPASGAKVRALFSLYPGGAGTHSYCDVVAMADGDSYFFVPFNRSTPYIYREQTQTFSPVIPIEGPVPAGQSGGTLLRSGRVIMAPYCATALRAYNPVSEAIEVLATGLSGDFKWGGICTARNGVAYMTPARSKRVAAYDENAMAGSQFRLMGSADLPIVDLAYGGSPIPLPDGKLLFVPYMETRAMVFDPVSGVGTLGRALFPGSESFWQGRLISSTRAIFYPHKHDRPYIYDFVSDEVTPFPLLTGTLGTANFNGGLWLPDGRDLLIPYVAPGSRAKIVDVENVRVHTPPGTYDLGACKGGCVMSSGHALLAPFNSNEPIFVMTGVGARLDPELVTSPHHNR